MGNINLKISWTGLRHVKKLSWIICKKGHCIIDVSVTSLNMNIKTGKSLLYRCTLRGLRQFLAAESSLKMMKNAFYFILKVLHILLNILGSKGNQTMKFHHLIEVTWEAILLKNHTQNVVEKLVPDPFLEN